jgi:hypothetical protein
MKYYSIKRAYDFVVGVTPETIEYLGPEDLELVAWSFGWLNGLRLKPDRHDRVQASIRLILDKMIELESAQRNSFKQSA